MHPDEFARWAKRMAEERGLMRREIAEMLGTTPQQLIRWEQYESPAYIGLAIAAVMHGLPPWHEPGARSRQAAAPTVPAKPPRAIVRKGRARAG